MICTTKNQAQRVAGYGADKMDAHGYTYKHTAGGIYLVSKPGQDVPYVVDGDPAMVELSGGVFCSCEFAKANQQFGACKHRVWLDRAIADGAPYEAEAAARAEYETYGKYDLLAGKY